MRISDNQVGVSQREYIFREQCFLIIYKIVVTTIHSDFRYYSVKLVSTKTKSERYIYLSGLVDYLIVHNIIHPQPILAGTASKSRQYAIKQHW